MLFTSGNYFVFLIIVFFLYWLLASKRAVPVLFLLAASYYFYALWNPKCLVLIFLLSTIDFLSARGLGANRSRGVRKLLLAISILSDVGTLFVFKYFNFFSASLTELSSRFGIHTPPHICQFGFAAGGSFITFRSLITSSTSTAARCADAALFDYRVCRLFPNRRRGPVVRAADLLPQFRERPVLTTENGTQAIFSDHAGPDQEDRVARDFLGKLTCRPRL